MGFRRTARYESESGGPGDPLWERQSRDMVKNALADQGFKTTLNDADILMLRDRVMATRGARLDYPVKIAQAMLESGEFSSVRAALETAKQMAPEYDANCLAAERMIIKKAIETELDAANSDDLVATILHLGKNGSLPRSASDLQQERQIRADVQKDFERVALVAN